MIDRSTPEQEAAECWRWLVALARVNGHATLDMQDPETPRIIAGRLSEGRTPEDAMALAALRAGLK